jgi:hypothetical protein
VLQLREREREKENISECIENSNSKSSSRRECYWELACGCECFMVHAW